MGAVPGILPPGRDRRNGGGAAAGGFSGAGLCAKAVGDGPCHQCPRRDRGYGAGGRRPLPGNRRPAYPYGRGYGAFRPR